LLASVPALPVNWNLLPFCYKERWFKFSALYLLIASNSMFLTFLCSKNVTRRNLNKSENLFWDLTNFLFDCISILLQLLASAALLLFVCVCVGALVICQFCDVSYRVQMLNIVAQKIVLVEVTKYQD